MHCTFEEDTAGKLPFRQEMLAPLYLQYFKNRDSSERKQFVPRSNKFSLLKVVPHKRKYIYQNLGYLPWRCIYLELNTVLG